MMNAFFPEEWDLKTCLDWLAERYSVSTHYFLSVGETGFVGYVIF